MKFIRVTIILLFNIFSIVQLQSQNNQFIELDSVLKETIFWDEKKTKRVKNY